MGGHKQIASWLSCCIDLFLDDVLGRTLLDCVLFNAEVAVIRGKNKKRIKSGQKKSASRSEVANMVNFQMLLARARLFQLEMFQLASSQSLPCSLTTASVSKILVFLPGSLG